MEALNKINETYKDEAFELVSVSINFREAIVRAGFGDDLAPERKRS